MAFDTTVIAIERFIRRFGTKYDVYLLFALSNRIFVSLKASIYLMCAWVILFYLKGTVPRKSVWVEWVLTNFRLLFLKF
jgi:hypothetical protein